MLILDKVDFLIKWAIMGVIFIALSLVASCADRASHLHNTQAVDPVQSAQAPHQDTKRRAPKGPAPTSASMMGKDSLAIETLLGAPSLLREETGAQIWQYAGAHCVLFLYLYEDGSQAYRVTHVEARIKGALNDNVDVCLAATFNT